MKNQNFYMRVLCLVVIIGAVLFYNSRTQEKEYQTQNEELTKRIDALEKQQQEILTALQENFDAQEKAKAESEKQKTETTKSEENADSTENADGTENTDSTDNIEKPDSTDTADQVYKDGTYIGDGQGFGGNIQVQITIADDTLTDIQVVSAEKEDSAYLSQGKAVIDRILEAQSTDVDTVSGATFSSTGILMAVEDALGKAENQ